MMTVLFSIKIIVCLHFIGVIPQLIGKRLKVKMEYPMINQ